jgi:probable phosphomutase (TIGR03848 family)
LVTVTSPEPTLAPPTDADPSAAAPAHRSTRIVLVRHAVTAETGSKLSGRAPGIDLSEEGRGQAERAGERLAPVPVSAVYASPIERTTQTAELIAKHHGLPVQPLPAVIEADYGEWTGEKLSDLMKLDLWKTVQVAPSRVRFPEGEAMVAMQARMVEAIEALVADHPGETVVVVSHADPIKAVVAHFTGLPLDLFQRIAVSPASVTVLELGTFGATLVKSNDTGSLDDLVPKATTTSASESGAPAPGSGGDDG